MVTRSPKAPTTLAFHFKPSFILKMAIVADALVTKVLDMLVSTIEEEIRRVAGVKEEAEKLASSLQSIEAVLADAERRQWKEETVQLWLDRLKSVAYDIDDILDEWSYKILKSQIEREGNGDKTTSKVWRSNLLYVCYCFPKVVSRHHMADKISKVNDRLDVIAIEKDRYGFQLMPSNIERSITAPHIDISEVKGRDVDKEKLVSMLLDGSSDMSKLRLISIVGMGGIGKTTLARLVYNDKRVKAHFHKRIWVCVSDPYDETRIAKEILESLQGDNSNLVALPNIMEKIQESLVEGEEYLFVLDDVWNEDPRKWEQLESCLKGSLSKSRILVTTRKDKVGRIMGCSKSDIVRVGLLSEESSWELFCMIAFFEKSSAERESLEEIGREVVRRCKGLPLAIKAIASLLRLKEDRREWQSVLDSEFWNQEEFQRGIAPALWLSYYDLPSHLKQCFSYCAIFPKDYKMKKHELVSHWIAHGYIRETESKDMEMAGEECFQNLVMRSFFTDVEVDRDVYDVARIVCKMHDIVHDFAQLLVKKECLCKELTDVDEEFSLDNSFVVPLRHLRVSFGNEVQCVDSFYNLSNLRSLNVSSSLLLSEPKTFGLDLNRTFTKFPMLRSMVLSNCGIVEISSNINRLIHLRELDLSNNDIVELPDTIWELYNLQILNLGGTKVKSVKGIVRLTNLRSLGNSATFFFLPKEMLKFSSLRRLERVNVDVGNVELFSLKHLKNFNQIKGSLVICWLKRGDRDVEDAKEALLQDKKFITRYVLVLNSEETGMSEKQDEELLEAINVPPNLEILTVYDYLGLRAPKWLDSLTFVKIVHLTSWKNCEHLPPLGKLPCLEDLELYEFPGVRIVGAEFLGIKEVISSSLSTTVTSFPRLKSIGLMHFNELVEWNDVDGDKEMLIMQSLTTLEIYSCPKLKALPNFILKNTSLEVSISDCDALEQQGTPSTPLH